VLFYHFTCHEHLEAIMRQGLSRGEVPITARECKNAVWLTTDPNPDGHGLSVAGELTDSDREMLARLGTPAPRGARCANKRAVRISVKIPRMHLRLVHWPKYAKKHPTPD